MKKITISILILAIAGIASYYFVFRNLDYSEDYENYSDKGTGEMNMSTTTESKSSSTTTWATTTTQTNVTVDVQVKIEDKAISIKGFAFNSSNLTVKKGTKITWTNSDSAPHTVTSDSGTFLNSATLQLGESYSQTFDQVGTFSYHCAIHPMMKGSITVTN